MNRERNKNGTFKNENYSENIGKKYSNLKVINIFRGGTEHRLRCKCLCKCGNTIEVEWKLVKYGVTKDCGCIRKDIDYKSLIGKRFGKLTVVKELAYNDLGTAKYGCLCDCGKYVEVNRYNLLGKTISCGCMKKLSSYNDTMLSNNKSGVKGVYFSTSEGKWVAKLTIDNKRYKRRFWNKEDAVNYRKHLEEQYHNDKKKEYLKYKK